MVLPAAPVALAELSRTEACNLVDMGEPDTFGPDDIERVRQLGVPLPQQPRALAGGSAEQAGLSPRSREKDGRTSRVRSGTTRSSWHDLQHQSGRAEPHLYRQSAELLKSRRTVPKLECST